MYLTRDQLILPRKDGNGNPTTEPDWHTLPTPNGGEKQIFGYMGCDDQAALFYNIGFFSRGNGIELGAFYGYSSALFALGMKHSPWKGKKLYSVDWFASVPYLQGDNTLERYQQNMRDFGVEDYTVGVQGSCEDPNVLPFTPCEFLYLDASHCLAELRINWKIFGPMLNNGGLAIWHDVQQKEVRDHIEECVESDGLVHVVEFRDVAVYMKP